MWTLIVTVMFALHPGVEVHMGTFDSQEACEAAATELTIYYSSEQPGDNAYYNCVDYLEG